MKILKKLEKLKKILNQKEKNKKKLNDAGVYALVVLGANIMLLISIYCWIKYFDLDPTISNYTARGVSSISIYFSALTAFLYIITLIKKKSGFKFLDYFKLKKFTKENKYKNEEFKKELSKIEGKDLVDCLYLIINENKYTEIKSDIKNEIERRIAIDKNKINELQSLKRNAEILLKDKNKDYSEIDLKIESLKESLLIKSS